MAHVPRSNCHQDLLCPCFCMDHWPDEALCMVFEDDMQFFEHHGIIPGRGTKTMSSSGPAELGLTSGQAFLFCSDLVKLVTQAHRFGKGEFIWIGYQMHGHEPREKTKCHLGRFGFGSQGIMTTKKAAKRIGMLWSGFARPGHIDVLLRSGALTAKGLLVLVLALCGLQLGRTVHT